MRAASIDINTPEFVLDGKDYAEPLTSVPIRSRVGAVAEALTGEGEGAAGVGSAEVEATRGHRIHMRDVAAHLVETLATPARAGTTAEIWTQTEEEAAEQRLALWAATRGSSRRRSSASRSGSKWRRPRAARREPRGDIKIAWDYPGREASAAGAAATGSTAGASVGCNPPQSAARAIGEAARTEMSPGDAAPKNRATGLAGAAASVCPL